MPHHLKANRRKTSSGKPRSSRRTGLNAGMVIGVQGWGYRK